jgi:Ca-activated chloride channel homolog
VKNLQCIVTALALGFLLASSIAAQEPRIVTSTTLVSVNVIVTDKSGHYIRGLARDDFEVFDEKTRQKIAHFSAEPAPVSLGIVYELHPATSERNREMLAALKQFTRNLRAEDDFFFMAFTGQGSLITEFVPTEDQVIDHLTAIRPGGASSLYDAVYVAADRLRQAHNLKKALLIVSDGEDDKSRTSYKAMRNRLREFDVQIYAIGMAIPAIANSQGFGRWVYEDITRRTTGRSFPAYAETSTGRAVLSEMARVSGGTAYYPETESEPELVAICSQIALELRQQYTIGFYPAIGPSDQPRHRIKIKMNPASGWRGLSLSYRQSYSLTVSR